MAKLPLFNLKHGHKHKIIGFTTALMQKNRQQHERRNRNSERSQQTLRALGTFIASPRNQNRKSIQPKKSHAPPHIKYSPNLAYIAINLHLNTSQKSKNPRQNKEKSRYFNKKPHFSLPFFAYLRTSH